MVTRKQAESVIREKVAAGTISESVARKALISLGTTGLSPIKRNNGGSSGGKLQPFVDVAGREIKAPIGSSEQEKQSQEASELYLRKQAVERVEQQEANRLVSSLRAREQITQEAQERGRAFTPLEVQQRLREQGTSVSELRQATRAAQQSYRKTGVSVQKQIREDVKREKEPIKSKLDKPTATPLSVESYEKPTSVYGQSYFTSFKQSAGNLGFNIKTFFTGRNMEFKDVLDPFKYSGILKRDVVVVPSVGTQITDPVSGKKDTGITYGDIQSSIEIKRDIKIGNITKEFKSKNIDEEQYKKEVKKVYEELPGIPNLYRRSGTEVKESVPVLADLGGYGIATAVAGPLGATGYGLFRGTKLAAVGKEKDVLSGTELYAGTYKLSEESKKAGYFFATSAVSSVFAPFSIAKELDIIRLKEGVSSPSKTVGKFYNINKQKYLKSITKQKTPFYRSKTTIDVPIIRKSSKDFAIGVGRGEQRVKFLPFSSQIGDSGYITVKTNFVLAGRGVSDVPIINGVTLGSKFSATLGEGYVTPTKIIKTETGYYRPNVKVKGFRYDFNLQDSFFTKKYLITKDVSIPITEGSKDFTFGGLSKDVGKAYRGFGGKISSTRIYPEVSGNVAAKDGLLEIPLRTTAKIPIKDTSIVFKQTPTVKESFGIIAKKIGGKSSASFFQNLYIKNVAGVGQFSGEASKTITSISTKTIKPSSGITFQPLQSIYYGKGIYERTDASPTISTLTKQPSIINFNKNVIKEYNKVEVKTISLAALSKKNIVRSVSINRNILKDSIRIKTRQANAVIQSSKQKQSQRQQQKQTQQQIQSLIINIPSFKIPTPKPTSQEPYPLILLPTIPVKSKKTRNSFSVQIRRGGKFFSVGKFRTRREAILRGKKLTEQTLAATFRVTGKGGIPNIIKGFRTKKTDLGTLFIEKRGKRLQKRGTSLEVEEILGIKRRTPKKKIKKRTSSLKVLPSRLKRKRKRKTMLDFL